MKYFLKKKQAILPLLFTVISTSSCVNKDALEDLFVKDESQNEQVGSEVPNNDGDNTAEDLLVSDTDQEDLSETIAQQKYEPRGIGGGGAMSGFSISPYSSLWFVGTDMGTLFRSVNNGKTWIPINHFQTTYSSDLDSAAGVGFSSDPKVVFHAPAGRNPVRSIDAGEKWVKIPNFPLNSGEKIKYWRSHSNNPNIMLAGTTNGLFISKDKGLNWTRLSGVNGDSKGTFIDYINGGFDIYHANATGIFKSSDEGSSFSKVYSANGIQIRGFTAGRDSEKITFVFMDNDGVNACLDVSKYLNDWGATSLNNHYANCGYVWTGNESLSFTKTKQQAGDHIKMAENDSNVIYTTGSTSWIRQYGSKVWKSTDAGRNWSLKLNQLNWDVVPFADWGSDRIEYSAAALDIGWHDGGYESFDINLRSSNVIGGTGYYFLHTSKDGGEFWNAPFTQYAGSNAVPTKNDVWRSTGLEVTTVYRFKFHPTNPQLGYAAMADMGGMVTEDGGHTFRITKVAYNSNYDYAFDPNDENLVYAVSGSQHDYPMNWHANAANNDEGGVYKSTNKGKSWTRISPQDESFNRQFLSIGYDYRSGTIYAGAHGSGIARSKDKGVTWEYFNNGLPSGSKIIPQIEIDPLDGSAYALVAGNAPEFTNQAQTGIYYLAKGSNTWQLLRQTVHTPAGVSTSQKLWYYPTGFAVDFSEGSDRSTLWLIDYENNKNWLATGIWKSTDRGANWNRHEQFTHPLSITLDQENTNKVYVNGLYTMDGSWGQGGLYYSNDGENFTKNYEVPFQSNARTATIDPNDPNKIFYGFFGSALLYGERP